MGSEAGAMQHMNAAAPVAPTGPGITPVRTADRPEAAGLSPPGYQQAAGSFTQPPLASASHFSSQTHINSHANYAQPRHSNGSSPVLPARGAAAATPVTADTHLTQQQHNQQSSSFGLRSKVSGFRAPSAAGFLHQYKKKQQCSNISSTTSVPSTGGVGTQHNIPKHIQQQEEEQRQLEQAQQLSEQQQRHYGASTGLAGRADSQEPSSNTCSLSNSQQQRSSASSPTAASSPRLRDGYARTVHTQQHSSSSSASLASSPRLRDKYAAAAQPQQQHSSKNSSATPAVSSRSLRDQYAAGAAAHTQPQRSTSSSNSSSPRLRDKYAAPANAGRQPGSFSSGSLPSASSTGTRDKHTAIAHAEQQQRGSTSSSPLPASSSSSLRDKSAAGSYSEQQQQQHSRSSSSSPLPSSSSPRLRDKFSAGGQSQQLRINSGSSSSTVVPSASGIRRHAVHAVDTETSSQHQHQRSSSSSHVTHGVSSPRLREKYGARSPRLQQQQQQQHIELQLSLQQEHEAAAVLGQGATAAQQQQQQPGHSSANQPVAIRSFDQGAPPADGYGTSAQTAIAAAAPISVGVTPGVLSITELELPSTSPDANLAGAAAPPAAVLPAAQPAAAPPALLASAAGSETSAAAATTATVDLPVTVETGLVPAGYQAAAVADATAAAAAEAGDMSSGTAADSRDAAAVRKVAEATLLAGAAGVAASSCEAVAADSLGSEAVTNVATAAPAASAGIDARRGAAPGNAADAAADAANSHGGEAAAAVVSAPAAAGKPAAAAPAAPAAAGLSSSSGSGTTFRGSTALPLQSSSDLSDISSSDISSSVSGALGDSSAQQVALEIDSDDGETTSLAEHQVQHQRRQQLMMQAAGHHKSSSPSAGGANPQQGQQATAQTERQSAQRQAQQESSGWGGNSKGAEAAAMVGRSISNDPDYEVPQGKLTETQVLMSHVDKLHLDRYGFIVTEVEAHARAAHAKRTSGQVKREQRHVAKWRRMLGSNREEFMAYASSRPNKVKRRVRKGIPDEFRGLVWQYLSGGRELMQRHPGRYAQLLTTSNEPVDLEIMRDLNRTFPNHVFFHQRQGPGQQSLFHVLRAYSAHDRQVGYVQGMGFVTAILLMYMSEEEAFWTLVALLKGTSLHPPLEGMYQAGMPLLQQCLFQFQELLKQENPKLGMHLEQEGVVPSMYCTHWFNTIFAYSLPFEQLLRVWDVFLLEGMKMVFRVGIVLLTSTQEQLLGMPFEKLVACLNGRKFPVLEKHPDVMLKAALRIPVSKRLEQLREKHQQQVAAAEAAARASSSGGNARDTIAPVAMGPAM